MYIKIMHISKKKAMYNKILCIHKRCVQIVKYKFIHEFKK